MARTGGFDKVCGAGLTILVTIVMFIINYDRHESRGCPWPVDRRTLEILMSRKIAFSALAAFLAIAATGTARGGNDSYDPGQAWIARFSTQSSPPSESSGTVVKRDPAQDFIDRLSTVHPYVSSPTPLSNIGPAYDPAQDFIDRLSTAHTPAKVATTVARQTSSRPRASLTGQ